MSGGRTLKFGRAARLVTEKAQDEQSLRLGLENIESSTGRLIETDSEFESDGIAFEAGDVLFGKLRPYLAKAWLADSPGAAVGDFHVYRPNSEILDSRFLKYVVLSESFLGPVRASVFGAKMPRASWDFVRTVSIWTPPLAEQRAIADYLDRETAQIDQLIRKNQALFELLEEKRSRFRHSILVNGVSNDPDLIESSITWLQGEKVPSHWNAVRLKHLLIGRQSGKTITAEDIEPEGLYPVFGGNGLRGFTDHWTNRGPHILIGRQGALCGNVHFVEGKFWASEHAIVCDVDLKTDIQWLVQMLTFMNLGQYSQSSAQPGISGNMISELELPLPPREEQIAIAVAFANSEIRVTKLQSEVQRVVTLAQERRAALITAAVTGQIDVSQGRAA